jgi:hypothetical protein
VLTKAPVEAGYGYGRYGYGYGRRIDDGKAEILMIPQRAEN